MADTPTVDVKDIVIEQLQTRIEALEKEPNEWQAATRHLLEHYPEDVFPPNSNTPDAKAGTFARRLLTWLLDPVERARLAALARAPRRRMMAEILKPFSVAEQTEALLILLDRVALSDLPLVERLGVTLAALLRRLEAADRQLTATERLRRATENLLYIALAQEIADHEAALSQLEKAEREGECTWTFDDFQDTWDTACRHCFQFEDGGPEENGLLFCGYCGKVIVEHRPELEMDDEE